MNRSMDSGVIGDLIMAELTCSEFKGILLWLYEDLKVFNKLRGLIAG
jgi:hypothetical protein